MNAELVSFRDRTVTFRPEMMLFLLQLCGRLFENSVLCQSSSVGLLLFFFFASLLVISQVPSMFGVRHAAFDKCCFSAL